jgi:hypothetical protein
MKFQIGDKVLLLHSNEEGEVVEIIDKKMVTVDVGGVQFPVYTDQIDFPYFKRFTEKKAPPPKQKKYVDDVKKEKGSAIKGYNVAEGVWISFLPVFDKDIFDDDVVEYFRIYLVNNTDTHYKFEYHLRYTGESEFNLRNEILPYNDFYIHDVEFEKLNDAPRFDFEFSLATPDKKKADHFEASLKMKAKQLFQCILKKLICINFQPPDLKCMMQEKQGSIFHRHVLLLTCILKRSAIIGNISAISKYSLHSYMSLKNIMSWLFCICNQR